MKKILFLASIASSVFGFVRFGTKVIKDVNITGYQKFDYAIWMHPSQRHKDFEFSKQELDFMGKAIPKGSTAIDIGAHTGDTSVAYAVVAGKEGKVLAFEPNIAAYEVLEQNAKLNDNIIPVHRAITEKEGKFTFHYTDPGLCNGGFSNALKHKFGIGGNTVPLKVRGICLESWLNAHYPDLIDKISFIKIDAEGYDKNILKNIKGLVSRCKPLIQCEVYPFLNKEELAELYAAIDDMGYSCFIGGVHSCDVTLIDRKNPLSLKDILDLEGKLCDLICFPIN